MILQKLPVVGIFLMVSLFVSCGDDIPDVEGPEQFPVISIESPTPISWETKNPCTIAFSTGSNLKIFPAQIKYRGGSSSKYDKHSFSVELENKYKFLQLPYDDDWILNASYIDKTFMRHKICYDLFRQMGPGNLSSQSIYVNVELNNTPQGLYLLMEEVNGGMAGLDKSDSMAMMFKDPPVFYKDRLPAGQDPENYYQQKNPKIFENDKTWYIEQFRDFLFNTTDSHFLDEIDKWVDLTNITDWHILLLLSNNSDGIMKNFYLYKKNAVTPFRLAIWDYDHSFGRDGDNELNIMERELDCNRSVLLRRLMEISNSGYRVKLKKRWLELRNLKVISVENITGHIEKNDKIIREEVERNFDIWPVNSNWYYDSNGYDEELEIMKEFARLRINQLDRWFDSF